MKQEDTRFFNIGSFEQDPYFQSYKKLIEKEKDGYIQVEYENSIVKIFNPSLYFILTTTELPVQSSETKKDTTINGCDYLNTFILGFNEGAEYFNREYANPEKYVKDIKYNYFDAKHSGTCIGLIGWQEIKYYHPGTISHRCIKEYGYYSGIVSEVWRVIKKYPVTFQNFKNHKETPDFNIKKFPPLSECFKDKNNFNKYILNTLQVTELYDTNEDGTYHWKRGKKASLAGLAHNLLDKGLLIDNIKTNQDLARVFCPYFHVKFNITQDKQFEPGRAKIEDFTFIK
jgi:hypothetical protein